MVNEQNPSPFGQYEYVDVVFPPVADTDQVINYTQLKPENVADVRWMDVTPKDIGGSPARVYQSSASTRKPFTSGYVVLRCDQASYATRLLLFTERVEGR